MESLLSILDDYGPTKKLKRVEKTRRGNTAEMRLYAQISQLEVYGLDSFVRQLKEWLEVTSVGNNSKMWAIYQMERIENGVEIWHTNAYGNRDRLVCILTEI